MLFEDALKSRLDLIKPSKSSIDECLKKRTIAFTSGVEKVVELLHERGTSDFSLLAITFTTSH